MKFRQILYINCATFFFLSSLVGIFHGLSLGSVFSFISGLSFFVGAIMDVRSK